MSTTKNQHPDPASVEEQETRQGPTRRTVVTGTAAGVAGAAAVSFMWRDGFGNPYTQPTPHGTGPLDDSYTADDVIYSMCMQCNTYCTIKVRLADSPQDVEATSLVRKIAGNPYSPLTTQPIGPIPYDTEPETAVKGIGNMARDAKSRSGGIACLKGQAGVQTVHDAKRITAPMKRVGPRDSGKWVTITWEEALSQILDGSDLGTPGLRQWWAFAPQEQVMADWEKVAAGDLTQAEFTRTWGEKLIDPEMPELGPKSNLLTVLGGDRMYLIGDRMAKQSFGTINAFNHGGTCGVTGVQGNVHSLPTSNHQRMYGDIDHARYLIVWGTEPLTAQKGPTWLAPRIGKARENGMKMVVIDPRMSKTAEKADLWVPVIPGRDGELAFAIARWIVDHERYDERYLRSPGLAAAERIGEPTFSDATHLIKVDEPGMQPLTLVDLGQPAPEPGSEGQPVPPERAVMVDGELVGADTTARPADLWVDEVVDGAEGPIRIRSVFSLVVERLREREIADYAQEAGVDVATVEQIGHDFTSHGKQAVVMSYRGPAMHANGFQTIRAINYLNFFLGNMDWRGGQITSEVKFSPMQGRYNLQQVEGANQAWGIPVTRERWAYEKSPFFARDGYPAKRRWYPLPGNLCHEVLPSVEQGYPYPHLNALFIHRHSPLNSGPGAHRQATTLANTDKIKLVVSFDTTVGDTSAYADFLLPDPTYLERFSHESVYPSQQYRVTQLGQPTTKAFDGPRPVEWFYLELAKALGLPGVGEDAFGSGAHFHTYEDYWLKMAANVAYAPLPDPVPDAEDAEQATFTRARTRALGAAYDEETWRAAVTPEEWAKVVYVLNRGGRFDGHDKGYNGDWLLHRYGGMCAFYAHRVAVHKDSYDAEPFDGIARIHPEQLFDRSPLPKAGPLIMTNWKSRHQGTHRTVNNAWLREVRPSNFVWVNPVDARTRGIANGDPVRITSASAEVEGVAMLTEGIRPGIIGADATFGHRGGYFSQGVEIDGKVVEAAKGYGHSRSFEVTPMHEEMGYAGSRAEGFPVNLLANDDSTGAGGVTDAIGGGAAQLTTWVELSKA